MVRVPRVANRMQHGSHDIAQKFEGSEHRGRAAERGLDASGVKTLDRGDDRRVVESGPWRRAFFGGRRRSARRERLQLGRGQRGDLPDSMSLRDRVAEQSQPTEVSVRVQPTPIVARRDDGAVATFPGTKRVDAEAGQP
jgi:hypothetical protein